MTTAANPEKIGRYQILERVGRGGMGVLFRGVDPVLDREVAIKLMLLDFSEDAEQMRPRFYREARAAAKLQHRNIVTVFEFAEEGNTPYIVMEFLRGTSLASRMTTAPPLTLDDKLEVVAQLCTALNYAHEQGVVHRDVKPANVFLLTDGTVKLLDFGIAKVTTSTLTRQGDVLGSASYMSPEQVSGSDSVDGRADVFSAGVVLYELLAGRKPFHAEAPTAIILKILHENPPPLETMAPGLPAQLVAAVNKALAKSPADRFQTAGEFAKELQWIRKALQASGEGAAVLEETRFASTAVIKGIQEAIRGQARSSGLTPGTPTPTAGTKPTSPDRGQTRSSGLTPETVASGTSRTKWLVPAAIGAVVLIGAIVAATQMGRGSAPTETKPPVDVTATPAGGPGATKDPASPPKTPDVTNASAKSGALQVDSDPQGARIVLDGKDTKQVTPASIAVTGAGPHRLKLSKTGFASRDERLADADLAHGSVSYKLQAAEATTIPVSIASTYPVEVFDGSRMISNASESHELNAALGHTLTVKSPEYFLSAAVKVEGKRVDYTAPNLGKLNVRSSFENCNVKIGSKDLGTPPIVGQQIAAGQYRVDVVCPGGQSPQSAFVTVQGGQTATATIIK